MTKRDDKPQALPKLPFEAIREMVAAHIKTLMQATGEFAFAKEDERTKARPAFTSLMQLGRAIYHEKNSYSIMERVDSSEDSATQAKKALLSVLDENEAQSIIDAVQNYVVQKYEEQDAAHTKEGQEKITGSIPTPKVRGKSPGGHAASVKKTPDQEPDGQRSI